jgi:hypothetical protein
MQDSHSGINLRRSAAGLRLLLRFNFKQHFKTEIFPSFIAGLNMYCVNKQQHKRLFHSNLLKKCVRPFAALPIPINTASKYSDIPTVAQNSTSTYEDLLYRILTNLDNE